MTTFYSQYPQTQFFNIPMLEAELTEDKLKLIADEFGYSVPVTFLLEEGTEVDDFSNLLNNLRGYTLTMLYSKLPGYFELYFTNRFDTRIVAICPPTKILHAEVDYHKVKNQDESRYRREGSSSYNYADLFARDITQWPANRYLRTVIKNPWWHWVIRKDADGEDDMILVMSNPHPADEDDNYVEAEITREMWERARADFLIIDAISMQVPRADSPSPDLYESIIWLGHYNDVDLWSCDNRFIAATWTERTKNPKGSKDRIEMFDLRGEVTPSAPAWVSEGVRRIRAYHPELDHLPFP